MRIVAILAALVVWAGTARAGSGFDGGVTPDGFGLTVEPTSLYLGTTSPGLPLNNTVKLTNTETVQSITVNGVYKPGTQCGAFTLTPPAPGLLPRTMIPMQMDTWTVTFTATSPGWYYCHVEFQDTDSNTDFVDLNAEVAAPMMSVSPQLLDFGGVAMGDPEMRAFYITNNGTAALTINSLTQSGSTEFVMSAPTTPFTVSPMGGSQTVYVTYTPINGGADSGSIVVAGNDPNNASDTVTLSGTGNSTGTGTYLDLSPDPLDFGDVDVGNSGDAGITMSVRNAGGMVHVTRLDISGPNASNFTIESHGCTGVQTCNVSLDIGGTGSDTVPTTIRCTPTSPWTKSAQLVVTSNATNTPTSASLTCNGVGPDIKITPTSLDFGTLRLGLDADLPVTIENLGNANLNYSLAVMGLSDYAPSPACSSGCILGPTESTQHLINFAPTQIGTRNASLVVTSNDPMSSTSAVSLTGIGGGGVLTLVQPSSGMLPFGTIPVGTASAPQMIVVRNDGNMNLKIETVELSASPAFDLAGTIPPPEIILAPTQTYVLDATCTPPDTTDYSGTVTYTSDAPVDSVRLVLVTCIGIDSDLAAMPAPIAFDATRVGDSDTVHVTISNISGGTTQVQGLVAAPGVFTVVNAPTLPVTLAAGDDTELDVRFTPTADGDVPGTLTIDGSTGDPLVVTLLGPGRVASFTVSPDTYDFGMVCAGSTAIKRFSVTSTGSADFEIDLPGLVDPDVAFDLAMVDPQMDQYPCTVTPSGTVTVDVTASPSSSSASGTLTLRTDVDPAGDVDVPLSIISISSGVGVGPALVDFGPVLVDGISTPQEVGLANCNTEPLLVSSVDVIGDDAAAFAVGGTLPPPDLSVPVTGSVRWTVVFRPDREGSHSASLRIMHAAGTSLVPLEGFGSTGDQDAGPGGEDAGAGLDTTSYYACWCRTGKGGTDPVAAAPIMLAFVLVLRRRRR